jgi:hypothetical protein
VDQVIVVSDSVVDPNCSDLYHLDGSGSGFVSFEICYQEIKIITTDNIQSTAK